MTAPLALVTPMAFYRLANGIVLYSEHVETTEDDYVFDGEKTAVVTIMPGQNGQLIIDHRKMSENPFVGFAGRMAVPLDQVVAVHNTVNTDLLTNIRTQLSGIQLVKGPLR